MKRTFIFFLLFSALFFFGFNFKDKDDQAKDYLNVPGPIKFDNVSYNLAWSANPVENYYKQEYITKGDSLERFNKMVLIDVLEDTLQVKDLVYMKINSLEKRKKEDAVVNYKLIQSPDSTEYIVDFVLSEGTPKVDFVEWNAYRYTAFTGKSGKKGVLLFGISIRSYGNNVPDFFGSLRDTRDKIITELMNYKIPPVVIQNG
jgi:hypothetical protein